MFFVTDKYLKFMYNVEGFVFITGEWIGGMIEIEAIEVNIWQTDKTIHPILSPGLSSVQAGYEWKSSFEDQSSLGLIGDLCQTKTITL